MKSHPANKTAARPALLDTDKIKARRLALGLTQEQAGRKAGIGGRQAFQKIEAGVKRDILLSTLVAVAGALGVRPEELLR